MQVTEIKKRKYFTKDQKMSILNELKTRDMTISAVARKHEIHPVTIHKWKREMANSKSYTSSNDSSEDLKEVLDENEKLKLEIENLKKALGEMAVDNQILKTYNDVLKKNQRKEKLKKQKK